MGPFLRRQIHGSSKARVMQNKLWPFNDKEMCRGKQGLLLVRNPRRSIPL